MKWPVVAGFLLCFVNSLYAGVLRCTADSEDEPCSRDGRILKKSDLLFGKDCLPGTKWTSQCNECTCTDDGLPSCTEDKCEGYEKAPVLRCAPDTIWKYECNTCWCTSTGYAMCTRIGCNVHMVASFDPVGEETTVQPSVPDLDTEITGFVDEDFDDHEITKRSICEPNQRFEVECNSCKCSPSGQSYSCTQSECLERDMDKEVEVFKESEGADHVERHSVCKPLAIFHVGCNTCHCNIEGTDFTCATKPCPLLNDVELFHELKELKSPSNITKAVVCAANRMFIKDCNTCWCNEDGTSYFCTRKVCVPDLPDETTTEEPEELREIERKCRPDEVFELDCNTCRCNSDGKSFSCTKRECVPEEDSKDRYLIRKTRVTAEEELRALARQCSPGEQFPLDCNVCMCNPDGKGFSCTRQECYTADSGKELKVPERQCQPDEVFTIDCNICRCHPDGKSYSCTRRECVTQDDAKELVPSVPYERQCNPNEVFAIDCNMCRCEPDGLSYSCTRRECEPQDIMDGKELRVTELQCRPNEVFAMDCNMCRCEPDGKSYSCTRRKCLPANGEKELKVPERQCQPDEVFTIDCNICRCHPDGKSYSCTRRECDPAESGKDLTVPERQCRPNEEFAMDCNTCRCHPDGKTYWCTRRECVTEDDGKNTSLIRKKRATSQETAKMCQPGQDFRMDCNMCLCDNSGKTFSCTRIDCNAVNNNNNGGIRTKREVTSQVTTECVPGSVFNRGCKACRCADDGRHAICQIQCQNEKERSENEISNPDSDPSFRCNPGEQYKRFCNDCTCSADGRSVFCTLRLCEEEITPTGV